MKDFEGKRIKVYLDTKSGIYCQSGYFIKADANFIVLQDEIQKKINYISYNCVKYIQIIGVNEHE